MCLHFRGFDTKRFVILGYVILLQAKLFVVFIVLLQLMVSSVYILLVCFFVLLYYVKS